MNLPQGRVFLRGSTTDALTDNLPSLPAKAHFKPNSVASASIDNEMIVPRDIPTASTNFVPANFLKGSIPTLND
jgi:hypothetical protein